MHHVHEANGSLDTWYLMTYDFKGTGIIILKQYPGLCAMVQS